MRTAFGIVSVLLVIGLPVVAITWIVRASRRDRLDGQAGWWLRRLLQYGFLLIALFSAASGATRVLSAALPLGRRIAGPGTTDLALGLSLTLVAVPIWVLLWRVVSRRLRRDVEERAAPAWSLYLATAATVSLIVAYVNLVRVGTWALGAGDPEGRAVAAAVVWGAVWGLHAWLSRRPDLAPEGPVAQLVALAGSAVGLVTLAIGTGGLVRSGLQQVFRAVAGPALVDASTAAWRQSLVVTTLAAVVWWWHWLRRAHHAPRSTPWLGYVLLVGVLGGLLTTVVGAAVALHSVVQWLIGDPEAARAAVHFLGLPTSLAAAVVGAWVWSYHRAVLGEAGQRQRSESQRAYEYLVAAVGLVAAAVGMSMALVAAIQALSPAPLAGTDPSGRNTLATAVTLLVVGAPLWWAFWRRLRTGVHPAAGARAPSRAVADDPAELTSPSRRAYLFVLFGVTGLTAAISGVTILYVVLRDLLEGALTTAALHDLRVAIALLITAGGLSVYHWMVHRDDREAVPVRDERPVRHVLLVSADDGRLADQIAARTGATVQALHRLDVTAGGIDVEAVSAAILASPHRRLLVTVDGDAVRAIPYEGGR